MMSDEEFEGTELLQLVGRAALGDPDSPIWKDERFLRWLRSRPPLADDDERAGENGSAMSRSERRLFKRILASATGIERLEGPPPLLHVRPEPKSANRAGRPDAAPRIDQRVAAGVGRELWEEIAEEWIPLPEHQRRGEFVALRIAGDSMAPLVHTGDTVLVRLGGRVEQGSVIVARDPANGYVCKRVTGVSRREIRLGSVADGYDPIVIPNDAGLVLGTVLMIWCEHEE
jgi:SOS-response transcriptional repressor LexA